MMGYIQGTWKRRFRLNYGRFYIERRVLIAFKELYTYCTSYVRYTVGLHEGILPESSIRVFYPLHYPPPPLSCCYGTSFSNPFLQSYYIAECFFGFLYWLSIAFPLHQQSLLPPSSWRLALVQYCFDLVFLLRIDQ
jgi:hypothetical protein